MRVRALNQGGVIARTYRAGESVGHPFCQQPQWVWASVPWHVLREEARHVPGATGSAAWVPASVGVLMPSSLGSRFYPARVLAHF